MYKFIVIEKTTGTPKYEYNADVALELVLWPFSEYDHVQHDIDPTSVPQMSEIVWTKLEFLTRFTVPERVAIRTAAKTDAIVEDFMALLNIAEFISSLDPNLKPALDYLQLLGILVPGRVDKILGVY